MRKAKRGSDEQKGAEKHKNSDFTKPVIFKRKMVTGVKIGCNNSGNAGQQNYWTRQQNRYRNRNREYKIEYTAVQHEQWRDLPLLNDPRSSGSSAVINPATVIMVVIEHIGSDVQQQHCGEKCKKEHLV